MSSYLFYSSPPPVSYNQQPSFFTPQAHRTNTFTAWPTFQPKSPSPLRRSHANVQRQPQQQHTGELRDKHNGFGIVDENSMQEGNNDENNHAQAHLDTPFLTGTSIPDTRSSTVFDTAVFTSASTTANPIQNTTRTPFQFQQRTRESSAQSQLSSRATNSRLERRSAFTNRLRNARRDDRDDRHIESFEKAEYWRERRLREEKMRRDAQRVMGEIEEEVETNPEMEMDMLDVVAEQLSPVSEEKEVEELVNGFYQVEAPEDSLGDSRIEGFGFEDDSGYEDAFMEVLSQEQRSGSQTDLFRHDLNTSPRHGDNGRGAEEGQDGDMDMS